MHLGGNRRWVPLFMVSHDQQSSCALRFTGPVVHLTLPFGLKMSLHLMVIPVEGTLLC